jgi:hypothetical protein
MFIAYVGREKKKDGRLVGFLNCPLGSSQRNQGNENKYLTV